MRTTVTLDADVAQRIRELMRERGAGFKETINDVLRRGLRGDPEREEAYEIPVFAAEIRPGIDLDKSLALAAAMEDDELLRKLSVGK